jgi:hypothetical protein
MSCVVPVIPKVPQHFLTVPEHFRDAFRRERDEDQRTFCFYRCGADPQ